MKKDTVIKLLWIIIVETILSTPLWIDKISAHLSIYFNTYFKWLLLETAILILMGYIAGYILDIPKLIHLDRKKEERIFKVKLKIKLLRAILYVMPIILGFLYFTFFYDISFRFLKFDNSKLKILVAEFREASLDNYKLAQEKYSALLKEKIKFYNNDCLKNDNYQIKTTRAFFSSTEEANEYAIKANADIVIWGELSKTEGYICISPKITSPNIIQIFLGDKISVFGFITDYTENWEIDGTVLKTDTLFNKLSSTIPIYILPMLKTNDFLDLFEYEKCVLENSFSLDPIIVFLFNYDLGYRYFITEDRKNSLFHYQIALNVISNENFYFWNKDYFAGLIMTKISKNYYFLFNDSLAEYYARESIKKWPDYFYDINVYTSAYLLNNKVEESLDSVLNRWSNEPDTSSGDFVLHICRTLGIRPNISFLNQYNKLYPNRLNQIKGGKVIYIKDVRTPK